MLMVFAHISGVLLRSHRHVLLASAVSLAALTVILLVPAAASAQPAASASAELATADAVTITASFAQPYVNALSTDTLSGVASYTSGDSSYPLASSTLSITSPASFNWPAISTTVTTAADGSFSYVTPEIQLAIPSVKFTVSSAATASLEAGQITVTLPVNQRSQIDVFTGMLSAGRVLRFLTCAGFPYPLAEEPLSGPLAYQYSRTAHGPWKTLGASTPDNTGPCATQSDGDGTYTGTFTAPLANAYYRAYALAVPGQMAAASLPIRLWDYPTKITGFTVTPGRVSRGGKVTVSGRLWRLKGTWRPDARRLIVIELRYKGKTYTLKHRLTTNSAGQFRGVFAVSRTAAWLALYKGGGKDFAVASNAITIKVR